MKNAEKYAAEFIRPPDEWLPTPTPLESAKGYRSRIIPMMAHFGKLLLKLYTQCVNLKDNIPLRKNQLFSFFYSKRKQLLFAIFTPF